MPDNTPGAGAPSVMELTLGEQFDKRRMISQLEKATPRDFEDVRKVAIQLTEAFFALRASARYFAGAPSLLPDSPHSPKR